MPGIELIQDLAIVLIAAGIAGAICRRLGLSPIVGYLLAGIVIGPYTPPFSYVTDEARIDVLAQLGLIFLMFSIGLGFSLRRLRQLGFPVVIATAATALTMFFLCRSLGYALGWSHAESLFLAGMLMVSSSAVIGKILQESGLSHERPGQLALGMTLCEDIVAVVMITLLTSYIQFGPAAGAPGMEILQTVGVMAGFVVLLIVFGLLLLPRILDRLSKCRMPELQTLIVAGLLCAFSLLAYRAGYSLALGAFLLGAIVSETLHGPRVERTFSGLRDVFSTVFFVAIGMSINVALLPESLGLVVGIALLTILGRTAAALCGLLLIGAQPRHALRAGLALTPLGEFSFIIAQIGVTAAVVPEQHYVIAVGVSLLTSLSAPFLIRSSAGIAGALGRLRWDRFAALLRLYHGLLHAMRRRREDSLLWKLLRKRFVQIGLELLIVSAILVFSNVMYEWIHDRLVETGTIGLEPLNFLYWGLLLGILLIPIVAIWRNTVAVAMIVADHLRRTYPPLKPLRQPISFFLQSFGLTVMAIWFWSIIPFDLEPGWPLLALAACILLVLFLTWRRLIRWHSEIEYGLESTLSAGSDLLSVADVQWQDHKEPWNMEVAEVMLPDPFAFGGISLADSKLRSRFGVTVAMIERQGHIIRPTNPENHLFPEDRLLLVGTHNAIAEAREYLCRSESPPDASHDRLADLGLEVVPVPEDSPHAGSPLASLNLTRTIGVQIVGIEREGARNLNPGAHDRILAGDRLLVLGLPSQIDALNQLLTPEPDQSDHNESANPRKSSGNGA